MSKLSKRVDRIRGTTKRLAEAIQAAREDIAMVEAREELTPEAKQAAVDARNDELREEIEAIADSGKEQLDALRAAAPAAIAVEPMEAMRVWARLERELQGTEVDPATLATRLAEEGDRTSLVVLSQELPSYLRSKKVGTELLTKTLKAVSAAESPLLSEAEAEYRAAVADAQDAEHRMDINVGFARLDGVTADLLVGAGPDENVDLKEAV